MSLDVLPVDLRELYEVHQWRHACAILKQDFQEELDDVIDVLRRFRLPKSGFSPWGSSSPAAMNFRRS